MNRQRCLLIHNSKTSFRAATLCNASIAAFTSHRAQADTLHRASAPNDLSWLWINKQHWAFIYHSDTSPSLLCIGGAAALVLKHHPCRSVCRNPPILATRNHTVAKYEWSLQPKAVMITRSASTCLSWSNAQKSAEIIWLKKALGIDGGGLCAGCNSSHRNTHNMGFKRGVQLQPTCRAAFWGQRGPPNKNGTNFYMHLVLCGV